MGKALSQHQIESYHKKVFISPIDCMSGDEANSYAEKLKAAETQYPRNLTSVNRNNGHLCFKFLDDLAYRSVILDALEDLLCLSLSLWGSVFYQRAQLQPFFQLAPRRHLYGHHPRNFVTL